MAIKPDDRPGAPLTPEQLVLNTIINNIPAMVFYKNLDGVYIAANEMFCKQLKTTPGDIIGKTDFDYFDAASAERYRETDLEVIETGKSVEGFDEEIIIDGDTRIFTTRKVLLEDHDGKPYGIIGLSYDVTDSRRAEQELIESRTRYKYMYNVFRLMADNIPDLLWAKDLRKRYLFVNKAASEKLMCASDTEEPIGKTDMYFAERERNAHPGDPDWHTFGEQSSETDDLTMKQKAPGRFDEFGNVRGQYMFLDVQKAPIMDEDGNMIGTVGSGRDITKQKLMEQEFQELYQRNRAIIEALPDLMFMFDDKSTYLDAYVSNFSELITAPEMFIGKKVGDFFNEDIATRTQEAITRCLRTETIQTIGYETMNMGVPQYYEARLIKVDENKVLCISRNITIQRNLQQELVNAKEKAEESSRLKSTLLNNMSHEIRTPLNGILGFSDILANEMKEPEFIEMANQINNSGKRLMKTLDAIMQLSQLESGAKPLRTDPVDIDVHLRQILEGYMDEAAVKGLFFEIRELPSGHGYIDSFFFDKAISNVLENAIKFTHKGGVIFEASELMKNNERVLQIRISDTGIGISDDDQKIIFDEFRQVSEGKNRSFEGTGLGLTIAIKMIRLMGGEISVESESGRGSLFQIFLPFPNHPAEQVRPASRPGQPSAPYTPAGQIEPGKVILLVEDNEVHAQLIRVYLRNRFGLDWAKDGATAIGMAMKKEYDAVLMDINPGEEMIDGIEIRKIIRQIQLLKKIPVIALTGYTMFGDRERLAEAGCAGALAKPVTKSEMLEMLDRVFT